MSQHNPFDRVLKALRLAELPAEIAVAGRRLAKVRTFKHDFFAVTALYEDRRGPVVLKVGRVADILGLPGAWIGRLLTLREAAFYEELADLSGVPAYLGLWRTGKGRSRMTGFAHVFVPGHPLRRHEWVGHRFFDQLRELLDQMHSRGLAYVDLNKRENILVGDDGRPHLIDFQISHRASSAWSPLARLLQRGDDYHFCKHKRRHRPDLCTTAEREMAARRSGWIDLHRLLTRPFQRLRRGALKKIDPAHESERTRLAAGDALDRGGTGRTPSH